MLRTLLVLTLAASTAACSGLMSSAMTGMADNVSAAILDQDDVETVREATPAYLVMLDGAINGDPRNARLLLAGANLYGSFASAFVEDPERRRRLTARSFDYGRRALCIDDRALCETVDGPYETFANQLGKTRERNVASLYGFSAAWAGWIEARSEDWGAIAEIPKVQAAMQRVVALDPSYDDGTALLYLGVLANLRPAALGGTPEAGREYFERAIEIGGGRNLMAKVLFARYYARNVFDRPLHDRLLEEVLAAQAAQPGLTLGNTIAQEDARRLLAEADEYF